MKPIARNCRRLLLCMLCTANGVLAATPPPDPKTVAADAPAPAAAAAPAASDADLAALGALRAGERRMLKADGGEFPVFVRIALEKPARGTLLLIPGDGAHPASAAAVELIHATLPAHGWSSWLLSLESPPRTWTATIGAAAAPPAAQAAADAAANPPAPPDASLDAQRAQELERWAERCRARIAAAIGAAAGETGKVVLVSEGGSALLLGHALTAAPGAVQGAVAIEPIELAGPAPQWPEGLGTPVLEILSPMLARAQGAARHERARKLGVLHYRQLTLETDSWHAGRGETAPARRLRGWLGSLDDMLSGKRAAD